jgi:hypothetical protein
MRFVKSSYCRILSILFILFAATGVRAQSSDLSQPLPLRTNQLEGRIAPRDIGDPRTTEHYYVFSAGSGDLSITVSSDNLIGDVDLFVAGSFRPLLKIVIYSEAFAENTRTIFMRQSENLILRVDARSTDDREGVYRIRFDGSFVPSNLPLTEAENAGAQNTSESVSAATNRRGGARRTTSVGGRIAEPERDIAETQPVETPPASNETAPAATVETRTPPANETDTPISPPTRRPVSPRRTARERAATTTNRRTRTTRTRPRPTGERSTPPSVSETVSETVPENSLARPELNAQLVIELTDGERNTRPMSRVRRMTVEGGEIVIVMTEGETERIPLTRVRRVSIEP